jgi:hypothetical protein
LVSRFSTSYCCRRKVRLSPGAIAGIGSPVRVRPGRVGAVTCTYTWVSLRSTATTVRKPFRSWKVCSRVITRYALPMALVGNRMLASLL